MASCAHILAEAQNINFPQHNQMQFVSLIIFIPVGLKRKGKRKGQEQEVHRKVGATTRQQLKMLGEKGPYYSRGRS